LSSTVFIFRHTLKIIAHRIVADNPDLFAWARINFHILCIRGVITLRTAIPTVVGAAIVLWSRSISGMGKESEKTEEHSVAEESSGSSWGFLLDAVGVFIWPEGIRAWTMGVKLGMSWLG
jgi:hypothetical protein